MISLKYIPTIPLEYCLIYITTRSSSGTLFLKRKSVVYTMTGLVNAPINKSLYQIHITLKYTWFWHFLKLFDCLYSFIYPINTHIRSALLVLWCLHTLKGVRTQLSFEKLFLKFENMWMKNKNILWNCTKGRRTCHYYILKKQCFKVKLLLLNLVNLISETYWCHKHIQN